MPRDEQAPPESGQPALTIGVPAETFAGERRVALVPTSVAALKKAGFSIVIERGAGQAAGFADSDYTAQGADLEAREEVFARADIIMQVRTAGANTDKWPDDLSRLRSGQILIGQCDPLSELQLMADLAKKEVTCYALELLPRISRAQSMDVLSSMAMVAGYRVVLLASVELPRMFPMMMTAAGTVTPSKVFVVGAGVAGLQAISAARRLGALVSAYDVRPAVKEEVQSLGATFVEMPLETGDESGSGGYARAMDEEFYRRQRELMLKVVAESHVVITTAAVPGKKAPILLTQEMVEAMPAGSVVVDLAAERGGNCALTKPGETVTHHGVTILGPVNVPSAIPFHASQLYSNNLTTFLKHLHKQNALTGGSDDEIVTGTLVCRGGQLLHPLVRELLEKASQKPAASEG